LWSPADPDLVVHRHVVPSLFCIPSLGAPLMQLPKSHQEIIRQWLGFYRRHRELLTKGDFQAVRAGGDYQAFHLVRGSGQVSAAFSAYPVVVPPGREVRLINASTGERLCVRLEGFASMRLETATGLGFGLRRHFGAGIHEVACPVGAVARFQP